MIFLVFPVQYYKILGNLPAGIRFFCPASLPLQQMNREMLDLTYYSAIAEDLQQHNPEAYEILDEEIHIILHKLKFIPQESRPVTQVIPLGASLPGDYLQELMLVAGAQHNEYAVALDDVELLIFIDETNSYLSTLPAQLQETFANCKAVKNNKIFIIQKANFAQDRKDYLQDIEILAEIIQSKYFIFGHEGEYWVKFDVG